MLHKRNIQYSVQNIIAQKQYNCPTEGPKDTLSHPPKGYNIGQMYSLSLINKENFDLLFSCGAVLLSQEWYTVKKNHGNVKMSSKSRRYTSKLHDPNH
jgi:hypothetical protein